MASPTGYPNTPDEIAGNATDLAFNPETASRAADTALRRWLSSSGELLYLGPTTWTMLVASRSPAPVTAAEPKPSGPFLSTHSSDSAWTTGPPAREMAAATPPPWASNSLAALTMTSTSQVVMSPSTTLRLALETWACIISAGYAGPVSHIAGSVPELGGAGPLRWFRCLPTRRHVFSCCS